MTFNIDSAMKYSYSNDDTCFSIDVINEILEEDFDALLDEGSKINHSIEGTLLEEEIFAEFNEFIAMTPNSESESDTEEPPFEKITFNAGYKIKTSLEEPPIDLELKTIPDNLEYVFLEEPSFLPVIISSQLSAKNKSKFESVKKEIMKLLDTLIIYPIADSPWVSPIHCVPKKDGITVFHKTKTMNFVPQQETITGWREYMLAIFHDMIEESVKVFMGDFSVFENSFDTCLNNLDKMLQRCKDAHLVLNWEKCHFMIKEGIVLGHKVSSAGLEVDKAKINVISKLPPPTNIKGVRSFIGHADFYRCFIKDFSKIARPITKLLEKDTPFEFNDECQKALELLKEKLTCAPVIVSPNWNLPFELMCDASDFAVGAVLGQKDGCSKALIQETKYANQSYAIGSYSCKEFDLDIKVEKNKMLQPTTYPELKTKSQATTVKWMITFLEKLLWKLIPKMNLGSQTLQTTWSMISIPKRDEKLLGRRYSTQRNDLSTKEQIFL
ncbi:reverse transcriptase domain-containing protein [Tanacetum coccineum]